MCIKQDIYIHFVCVDDLLQTDMTNNKNMNREPKLDLKKILVKAQSQKNVCIN